MPLHTAFCRFTLAATVAASLVQVLSAQVAYQYTGNHFNLFTCGFAPNSTTATSLCSTPGSNANSSYTPANFVSATLTLDTPLAPNLVSQDVSLLPGFKLTMNDGQQTKSVTSTSPVFRALVSTDSTGNIVAPWLVFIDCICQANSDIATENGTFQNDNGILSDASPTPANGGFIFNSPGTWGPPTPLVATPTYGTAARVLQHDQFPGDAVDITLGDIGVPQTPLVSYSTVGIQAAYPRIAPVSLSNPWGLSSGAWSDTALAGGAARGIAFRNFINVGATTLNVRVNAVLSGKFMNAPFGLPDGPAGAGGAIHVYDGPAFAARLQASGKTAAQYLVGGYSTSTALSPQTSFATLLNLLPAPLADGAAFLNNGPFNPVSIPVSTTVFPVAPQQVVTVLLDVATSTIPTVLADGTTGGDDVYFLDTLQPAANFFTDANGNPVTGMAPVDSPPATALPPTPATLTLAPTTSTNPVGLTATVTATATASGGVPVPSTIVRFTVTSGPNAGVFGAAVTDPNGNASFTWADNRGAGTDTIQANIGSLTAAAPAQATWAGPAACPQGQGFWKNHTSAWPVTTLNLGSQTYNQAQLLQILDSPGGGDASTILVVQLIAAKLNIANRSDRSPASAAITAADILLAGFPGTLPYGVKPGSTTGQAMTGRASTLDSYNSGALTPACVQ